MNRTSRPTWAPLLLLAVFTGPAACVDDTPNTPNSTCPGDLVAIDTTDYCVFAAAVVVEEGFACPASFPNLLTWNDVGVCARQSSLNDERLRQIADRWHQGVESNNFGPPPSDTAEARCVEVCDKVVACEVQGLADHCVEQCAQQPELLDPVYDCVTQTPCASILTCFGAPSVSAEDVNACLAEFPDPLDPNEVVGHRSLAVTPEDPNPPTIEPDVTVAVVEAECTQGNGINCDATQWINREAARCIATAAGFEPGLAPWEFELRSFPELPTEWFILNVTVQNGSARSGHAIKLDALTGALLLFGDYDETP